MKQRYDAIIVGGGAAGLMAACVLAEQAPEMSIAILEKNDRVGKKLLTTGNGRCNLSNAGEFEGRYHGDAHFAAEAFRCFGRDRTLEFFKKIGVPTVELELGKLFPQSLQAGAVVDQLRFMTEQLGVETICSCNVRGAVGQGDFAVDTSIGRVFSRYLLIAGGGRAAADGGGYALLEGFGHRMTRTFPAIVQLTTDRTRIKALTGIKVDAEISITAGGKKRTERGEVLFTEYGLSGPPVLQVSRLVSEQGRGLVMLDLLPDTGEEELKSELLRRAGYFSSRESGTLLVGILNKRLGETVIKAAGVPFSAPCGRLTHDMAAAIAHEAKHFTLNATGTKPWSMAQVTAGGIETSGFCADTMQSRLYDRLYAAGEILDVDGDCGGFNLQWAWTSGALAAESIAKDFKGENS